MKLIQSRTWQRVQCLCVAALLALLCTGSASADHQHHAHPRYLDASRINWLLLIAPPPAPDSMQQQRDLQTVLDIQATYRSGERNEQAIADSDANCFRFADVLGSAFNAKQLPITAAFLSRAADEVNAATSVVKHYWQRPRPFVVSDKVKRLADVAPRAGKQDATSLHAFEYSSYPSSHATYGMTCAMVLTQMVPEKQAQLFNRAIVYGESRLIVGGHFPSDLLAGRMVATAAVTLMTQNSAYQHDLKAAKKELRQVLATEPPPITTVTTTKM